MNKKWMALGAIALFCLFLLLITLAFIGNILTGLTAVSPTLARVVAVLLYIVLFALFAALLYYGWLFLRPKRKKRIVLPDQPTEVAALSLQAAEQQVAQIDDEIARQALAEQQQNLASRLNQQTFEIVVFGLGSTGKTALINALIGEDIAPVAATIGTTTAAQTYQVEIPSTGRLPASIVRLVDTPGLLEVGQRGLARSQQARELASAADLILFVVDNDLTQVVYELLEMLAQIGKRLILVVNKCDRFLPSDRDAILSGVRSRTAALLSPADVVGIAACPAPAQLSDGTWTQPDPQIEPLVSRLLALLAQEGPALMARNLLLQSQQLSAAAQAQLAKQRRSQAEAVVERYQWVGGGILAATPLPVVDMIATAAVNAQMVVELGRVYGVQVSIEDARALVKSLTRTMAGLSIAKGAMRLLSVGLQVNPVSAIASKLVQGASAAYLTRIAGRSFITYFEQNQTWGDGGIQAVVAEQYQLNQRDAVVKEFVQSALSKLRIDR